MQASSTANITLSGARPVIILADKNQAQLAQEIVATCQRQQESASQEKSVRGTTRSVSYKDMIVSKTFPDGFPDLFIKDVKEIYGKHVVFIASFHSVDVLFGQISLIYQMPRYLVHSFSVILPYFPTGTMERIDKEGQIPTAKTLAMLLSQIPPSTHGASQIVIFDIHALQERFYFTDSVIPRLESAIPLVINAIESTFAAKNQPFVVVFPDDGAEKRFSGLFPPNWSKMSFLKKRDCEKRLLDLKDAKDVRLVQSRNAIIVDDLVQTGGTVIEAAKALKNLGASSVSAYVTHAVFPNESWRKFTDDYQPATSLLQSFWITDSLPHARRIAQRKPFQLLSLAPLIADLLTGFELKFAA